MSLGNLKQLVRGMPFFAPLYRAASLMKLESGRIVRRVKLALRQSTPARRPPDDSSRTLILEIAYGGLGDTLFHSHIPRIAKASGKYSTVLMSNVTPFRNPAHRRLVWELNPYVDGFTDKAGTLFEHLPARPRATPSATNILDRIMLAYGLDDGVRFHEPEIYYAPKKLPAFEGKTIFDPNWISAVGNDRLLPSIEAYLTRRDVRIDVQFAPRAERLPLPSCAIYVHDQSFEEFCDILHSCSELYCFATGTAVLAAALGKKAHVFHDRRLGRDFIFSKRHEYICLDDESSA